jgi:uncharacterized protein
MEAKAGRMIDPDVRDRLMATPETILDDREMMQALVAANDRIMGSNVVDLRGIAMQRLESRLDRLEDTHRHVIAAAYENLAGTNAIHRAVLALLEPLRFDAFLKSLANDVAPLLRVDALRLVLESPDARPDPALLRLSDLILVAEPGFVAAAVTAGRNAPQRTVTLRAAHPATTDILYGDRSDWIRSEALLKLDFGPGRLPGLLAMGAEDPHQFRPAQGTDLLAFLGGVFERTMRRFLA